MGIQYRYSHLMAVLLLICIFKPKFAGDISEMVTWDIYKPVDNQVANRTASALLGHVRRLRVAPKRMPKHLQFMTNTTPKLALKNKILQLVPVQSLLHFNCTRISK